MTIKTYDTIRYDIQIHISHIKKIILFIISGWINTFNFCFDFTEESVYSMSEMHKILKFIFTNYRRTL